MAGHPQTINKPDRFGNKYSAYSFIPEKSLKSSIARLQRYTFRISFFKKCKPEFKVKITARKTIYDGFFKVEQVSVDHQGETLKRDMVTNKDAVAALVFNTVRQEYLLIEQYRVPADKPVLEIVAGLLDKPGENPEEAIKREIEEEVGFVVEKLE